MANPVGRPSKYTEEIAQQIADYVKNGLSRKDAAIMCGINPDTVYSWIQNYPEFSERIAKADAISINIATSVLVQAINSGNYKAALAWLQAKRGAEWRTRATVSVENADNNPFQVSNVDLSKLSTQQLESLLAMAADAVETPED